MEGPIIVQGIPKQEAKRESHQATYKSRLKRQNLIFILTNYQVVSSSVSELPESWALNRK